MQVLTLVLCVIIHRVEDVEGPPVAFRVECELPQGMFVMVHCQNHNRCSGECPETEDLVCGCHGEDCRWFTNVCTLRHHNCHHRAEIFQRSNQANCDDDG